MESLENQYGFDENIFISDVPEYLHCMLCSLVLRNPVQILACGHKMCDVCFQRIKTHPTTTNELRCPIDRDLVDVNDVREDKYLKRVVGNLAVRCRNHDRGCEWSSDLSELETHLPQCSFKPLQQRDSGSLLVGSDIVTDLINRLERCESSNVELQEKQKQQQQDLANLRLKNEVLEQKMSELTEKNMELQEKQKQLEKSHQQHREEISDLKGISEGQKSEMNKTSQASSTHVAMEQPAVIPKKRIVFEHHSGSSSATTIDNNNRTVVFHSNSGGEFATVSARSVVVPPHTKVWFEVEYTHCGHGYWNSVGWATPDLPTSLRYISTKSRIGGGTDSYGFKPFSACKEHNGWTSWGKKFTGETGVVGVALDLVKGEILFSVGGQWTTPMGVAFTDVPTQKKFFPAITGDDSTLTFNFGDRSFKHGPPDSSYKTLMDVV